MSMEIKKIELAKKRVQLGLDELEFRILEREADITRIKETIIISKQKITDLNSEISELKGENK